jgi:regulator of replication initiation timing
MTDSAPLPPPEPVALPATVADWRRLVEKLTTENEFLRKENETLRASQTKPEVKRESKGYWNE